MSKLAVSLALKIERELGIKVVPEIQRTRAGRHLKRMGAWSWFMYIANEGGRVVASQFTAKECNAASKLKSHRSGFDVVIEPEQ